MFSRRGQQSTNAGSAAVLVLIIAAALIFYVLLLSPADRAALLDDQPPGQYPCSGQDCVPRQASIVLLSENVGRIEVATPDGIVHTMPSFTVRTTTQAQELARTSVVRAERSAFSNKDGRFTFQVDREFTDNVLLSFTAPQREGTLTIWLNGNEVYRSEVTEESPAPIRLPPEFMLFENELVFSVSSPGFAFWRKNVMDIRDVLVSGMVTDISDHESRQQVAISEAEYRNLETGQLRFTPLCDTREPTRLTVLVNNVVAYAARPDCGAVSTVDLGADVLHPGTNAIVFAAQYGGLTVDSPKVVVKVKPGYTPTFYYNVPADVFERIKYGGAKVVITMRFTDQTSTKRGIVNVNGFVTYFETNSYLYDLVLDARYVTDGPNSVKIMAESQPLDIAELRVEII